MAKHKVDRAAPEGADEAVLNLQQVDALAKLKKKIEEGVEESEQAAAEAPAEQAPAEGAAEVSSADAALLASSDTVFTSTASHTLVAQAGGGATGGASGLPGWVVPVTAAGVGVAAIVVASDSDSGSGGDGGGQPVNPGVQTVTPNVTSVNENGDDNSVTFTIQTDGTGGVVNFEILGLSANDIASINNASSNQLTGTTEVDGSGRALVTIVLAADGVTEGAETLTLRVTGAGDPVTSVAVTVNDTSVGNPGGGDPAVEISSNAGADNAVGEGQAVTFAFDASNLPANANVQFIISGNNLVTGDIAAISGQNGPVQLSGFLTTDANGNLAPLTITVNNDNVVDGPEDLTLTLRLNGVTLATSTVDIIDSGTTVDPQTNLTITSVDVDGSDLPAARLTGDQDIRIDFTNPARQIVGLDLNGNGAIAADGRENNPANADFIAALGGADIGGYGIVDAYARNPLNAGGNFSTRDNVNNFYGDIDFDGTGFDGDGVSTDGNIFLGGFGADTALGGIGNDFLTGGGVGPLAGGGGDVLSGGRNGDFFFGEGSLLSSVDGDALFVNGGSTSDDLAAGNNSAQDSDMFLGEFSDDDEPIVVRLTGQPGSGTSSTTGEDGRIISDNGISIEIDEIEHYDASGNLYGFLDGVDVIVGGRQAFESTHTIGEQNYGIGSSAQHDILGSVANNILIGGFDNDIIAGAEGNDILFGGRFDFLNNRGFVPNPNLQNIVNNGIDTLLGGDDDDSIVFEADGGTIRGDSDNRVVEAQAATGDTLYLTEYGLGRNPDDNSPVAAEDVTDDNVLRFDLQAGDINGSAQGAVQGYRGYGGADVGTTADQSNYSAGGFRVDVTLMENFIATGMGAADYRAAGSNTPELGFNNQQNVFQYDGNLDIRGSDETNVLYSSSGDDTIEGRQGDDFLSGGTGNDDFIFNLEVSSGDGVDVIHRQTNAGLNLWARDEDGNGLFEQDFNAEDGTLTTVTNLSIDFTGTAFENPPLMLASFEVTIGTERYTADLGGATFANLLDLADAIAANLVDPDGNVDPNVSVRVEGNSIVIEDNPGEGIQGRDFDASFDGFLVDPVNVNNVILLTQPTVNVFETVDQDRLIYQSYEDRFDGEKTNDDTQNGSNISLGLDAYAEDLVAFFGPDGTRLAEDQSYTLTFDNLTTQDVVTVSVNGVDFSLTVGRNLDGSIIENEDIGTPQAMIQANFLVRLVNFINSFNDTNTAAGEVGAGAAFASVVGGPVDSFAVFQVTYNGEQTVFINAPVVNVDDNTSGGQIATATVTNNSQHEVFLLGFDGRDNNLNSENVLFLGDTGISRSIFETASNAGGDLLGTDAVVVDSGVSDLDSNGPAMGGVPATGFVAAFVNPFTNAALAGVNNFTVHGDDFLIGGDGDDGVVAGTGDDRVVGSRGNDTIDGGKDLYSVRIATDPLGSFRVIELNLYEARVLAGIINVAQLPTDFAPLASAPDLAGFVPGSLSLINQTETGTGVVSGLFNDVLQYQQQDFTPGAANAAGTVGTTFTVAVTGDDFVLNLATGLFELRNGGAGVVNTFENGEMTGSAAFQEIEAVRTVSGTGAADASGGQGRDTLDISAISDAKSPPPGGTIGVLYNLTGQTFTYNAATDSFDGGLGNEAADAVPPVATDPAANFLITGGQISYSRDAQEIAGRAQVEDFEQAYGLQVDGVENVTSGAGNDIIIVDEGEANKDNVFTMGLGRDRVIYANVFLDDNGNNAMNPNGLSDEATDFRVIVGAGPTDPGITHTIEQTNGRNGGTEATDTLIGVQAITLYNQSGASSRGADFIDLVNLAGGVVNYQTALPNATQTAFPFATQSVSNLAGTTLLTIEGINQLENVDGSAGADQVLVASGGVMANANTLLFNAMTNTVLPVQTFLNLNAAPGTILASNNVGQFTFDLMGGMDTVDYSDAADDISLAVTRGTTVPQYVLVDADAAAGFRASYGQAAGVAADRVDQLDSVEQVIASRGDSILDLTGLALLPTESNFQVVYGGINTALNNPAIDRVGYNVNVNAGGANNTSTNLRTYGEYRDGTLDAMGQPFEDTAAWNRIEGGNFDERVLVGGNSSDAVIARLSESMTFNLRGSNLPISGLASGGNSVQYGGYDLQAGGVTVAFTSLMAFDPMTGTGGTVALTANFSGLDGIALGGPGHVITSNTQDNQIAAGQLVVEGALSGNDSISLAGLTDPSTVIIGGQGVGGSGEIRVQQDGTPDADGNDVTNEVIFLGFENIQDNGATDDLYSFSNFAAAVLNTAFSLTDAVGVDDHDAIGVDNSAVAAIGQGANTLDLAVINAAFTFDFDVLDITRVTAAGLILVGTSALDAPQEDAASSDEVVVGNLAQIVSISEFEGVVLTEATAAGGAIVLDLDNGVLTQGVVSITHDGAINSVSAGGLVQEADVNPDGTLDLGYPAPVDAAVSITVVDTMGTGVALVGGNGDDTLVGASGDDIIIGGLGADTLSGGSTPEVLASLTVSLEGVAGAGVATDYFRLINGIGGGGAREIRFYLDGSVEAGATGFAIGAGDIMMPAGTTAIGPSVGDDVIGAAIAQYGAAAINAGFMGMSPLLDSVDYDPAGIGGVLTFTYASGEVATAADLNIEATAGAAGTVEANGILLTGGAGVQAAQGDVQADQMDSQDEFGFNTAADSTADASDVITDFTINGNGGVADDTLALELIQLQLAVVQQGLEASLANLPALTAGLTAAELDLDASATFANLTEFFADADAAFAGNTVDALGIYVASNGTDGYVAVDANADGAFNADDDMVIILAGFQDATDPLGLGGFDLTNVGVLA